MPWGGAAAHGEGPQAMGRWRWSWGSRNTAFDGIRILLAVDELRSCAAPTQPRPREEGVPATGDGAATMEALRLKMTLTRGSHMSVGEGSYR
jgi:hypothetical protein